MKKERLIPTAILVVMAATGLALLGGCRFEAAVREGEVREAVLSSEAWWNDGDLEAYMGAYWDSPDLRFVSGDSVTMGWQKVLDGYLESYPDQAAMGRLTYGDLDITLLSKDSALAFGSWKLDRGKDQPHGLFTLVLRHFKDGWKIIHDHTSLAE